MKLDKILIGLLGFLAAVTMSNKVLASENPLNLDKDGYYRIIGGMQYYADIKTGEVDDSGNSIEERVYHDIAMYSDIEGFGSWQEYDATDCRQIWRLEQKEGGIKMVNLATNMQFSKFGHPIEMNEEVDTLMCFDLAGEENGRDIIYIRFAGAIPYTNGVYLHQWEHHRGSGTGYKMCAWNPTFNMGKPYESDKGTSEWYLEEVSDEEANALMETYIGGNDVLCNQFEELLSKAKDVVADYEVEAPSPTIFENSQFSSWCTETSEGSINNLLDGNSSTFWHSTWTGGIVPNHTHGIDVIYDEPVSGTFKVWVNRRGNNTNDDNVTLFSVYGCNDKSLLESGEETGWTQIGVQTLPWSSSAYSQYANETFTIEETSPYQYLRFYCDETRGPNSGSYDRGYFHMGDFQVCKMVGQVLSEGLEEVGNNLIAAIATAESIDRDNLVYDDYLALKAAYDAFMTALDDLTVDPVLVERITLNEESVELYPENTVDLTATLMPTNATNKEVKWSSSNENVAIVENGLVTALRRGYAWISATTTDGSNLTARCYVRVVDMLPEENVTISVTPRNAQEWQVSVALENQDEIPYCAFQMDLSLPTGITYQDGTMKAGERIGGYNITLTPLSSNNLRILSYSSSQKHISAGSGELFTLILSSKDVLDKGQSIVLKNIRFSDEFGREMVIQGMEVDLVTGLSRILADGSERIYSIQGVRLETTSLSHLPRGIYIVDGRKVLVR